MRWSEAGARRLLALRLLLFKGDCSLLDSRIDVARLADTREDGAQPLLYFARDFLLDGVPRPQAADLLIDLLQFSSQPLIIRTRRLRIAARVGRASVTVLPCRLYVNRRKSVRRDAAIFYAAHPRLGWCNNWRSDRATTRGCTRRAS